jgi:protein ImuB
VGEPGGVGGVAMSGGIRSKPSETYACVVVQEFAAQAMLRLRPELRGRAVAVMQGEPPMQVVCAVNGRARGLGVAWGMTRVEVETFGEVVPLARAGKEEASARAALLECAGSFSPRVEESSGGGEFVCAIDIAGTERLLGQPGMVARNLARRVGELGVAASVAVSGNFWAAVCAARGSWSESVVIAPAVIDSGREAEALAGLPIAVLAMAEGHAEVFSLWGIRTLGELAALPERELVARLGQEGRRLRAMARGEWPHLLVPVEAEFRLEERMELEAPVELMESLLFGMGAMLEQLVVRAAARVLALASLTVALELEGSGTHTRTVRPALPSNDRAMWIKLLHLDLEVHPPGAAVVGVELQAEAGSTSKVQLGLFSPQVPEAGRLDVTLARIRAIVGEDCVGRAVVEDTHRVEGFRMEGLSVACAGAIRTKARERMGEGFAAMRQMRPAERIWVRLEGRHPEGFVFRERRYAVERAYGPWVSGGDWWNPTLWGREEWDLVARAEEGGLLCCCVVREAGEQAWRMAGIYD